MRMNKLSLVSTFLLTAIAIGVASPALADETNVGGSTGSKGTISWTSNDDGDDGDEGNEGDGGNTIDPTDPDKPGIENPGGGDGDGGGDMSGPLVIDYVSKIDFGTRKISGNTEVYHAKYVEVKNVEGEELLLPTYLQVTDNRGLNDGWNLEVSNTQFSDKATGDKLEGAVLTLGANNKVFTQNVNGSEYAVIANGNISLTGSSTSQKIVSSENNKGMGQNTVAFGEKDYGSTKDENNSGVTLEVPGKTKKNKDATYVSELTWTLSQTEI